MDRLIRAIDEKANPSVVGLDPTPMLLPEPLLAAARAASASERAEALAQAYFSFNKAIIDAVKDVVPAVKPQIAMYEALGVSGVATYVRTTSYAHDAGLYVLGDIKRGDIGSTASAYASHLSGMPPLEDGYEDDATTDVDLWHEDAVTVNPYLGTDGITPFVEAADRADKDLFVLVRTSNPSSRELQELDAEGTPVSDRVGDLVETWGEPTRGDFGYSRVGAVVGATHREVGRRLRARLPHTFFLVPGFGAQGGTAADIAPMFDSAGRGALVNSSRGIIGAWRKDALAETITTEAAALDCVATAARTAALTMKKSIVTELEKNLGN
ncbi:MAG: orotidine-5'-phosphate decarboxylase [Bifidobacteriaceae bacterium]|nr:orotidine-5'-phosphate decarboxylase [Bifidobacteriaceae bacterium]MCI1914175.1 orotidine-5'-phosphate decarboxylase [Bifidobacteriaceae bacterium]